MDKITRNLKHRDSFKARVADIFRVAREWHQDANTISSVVGSRVRNDPKWMKVPGWVRDYVEGYIMACNDELMRRDLVFAYDVGGTRYILGSPEYNIIDPGKICNENTWSGYVWREDPEQIYFGKAKDMPGAV